MVKRFSIYLTFATCASFTLILTAIGLLIIEYKRGTVQEIYDSSLVSDFFCWLVSFVHLVCGKNGRRSRGSRGVGCVVLHKAAGTFFGKFWVKIFWEHSLSVVIVFSNNFNDIYPMFLENSHDWLSNCYPFDHRHYLLLPLGKSAEVLIRLSENGKQPFGDHRR